MRPALALPLGLAAAGVSAATYGWAIERKAFRLRRVEVPILAPGARGSRVLHVSDLHATPGQPWKVAWVRSLAELEPDLVINTGDNLASMHGAPVVLEALGRCSSGRARSSRAPTTGSRRFRRTRRRYLLPDTTSRRNNGQPLPWGALRSSFTAAGWLDLTHRRTTIVVRGVQVELAGVSDAHLDADHYDRMAGKVTGDVAIGLSHCPEPRVIDAFAADGFSLVMSGHTHGGQLRVPGFGALVTNCGLERRRARGLSRVAGRRLAARLGRSRHLAVRAGSVRLPARGDAADPNSARSVSDLP